MTLIKFINDSQFVLKILHFQISLQSLERASHINQKKNHCLEIPKFDKPVTSSVFSDGHV